MGEIIVSPLLQVIFEKLTNPLIGCIGDRFGLEKEVKKLERTLYIIQAVLADAEEQQFTNRALRIWLTELKEVAYEIVDLLDEFSFEAMQSTNPGGFSEQVRSFIPLLAQAADSIDLLPRLKQIKETLEQLAEEKSSFNLRVCVTLRGIEKTSRETGSFVIESEVFGRDEDKEKMIEMLLSSEVKAEEFDSIIPIVGLGGLGKTTLAQLVYNDERVLRDFEMRMWVCVNNDFDVRKIVTLMIESATGRRCDDLLGMDALQSQLKDMLCRRRYLLVLDDVWNEDEDEWDKLKPLLRFGAEGSKVIVTTRSAKVAAIMNATYSLHLKGLSQDDCWALFKQRAFAKDLEDYPKLFPIGKEIVKKCGGVPLAAKTMGSVMRFKRDPEEWLAVQESDLWNVCLDENGILPALRLSYSHLSSHLKRCFIYCSIFPKNYVIKKEKLIHLWIAEGLIKSFDYPMSKALSHLERNSPEDIGSNYFNDLIWLLFFEEVKKNSNGDIIECKMHDIIHDLAKSVAGEEFFTFERDCLPRDVGRVRYATVVCDSESYAIPEALYEAKKLRTLIFLFSKGGFGEIPAQLFSNLRNLRVLDLNYGGIKRLQSSVSCLKHLRYLSLSNTFITSLPETIARLCYLQVLDLSGCSDLTCLPSSLVRIFALRHLIICDCENLTCLPDGIGKLFHLQTLPIFIVSKDGDNLDQLMTLRLRGKLTIKHLENVQESTKVILRMNNLHSLDLCWGDDNDGLNWNINTEKVPSCPEPPQSLKHLTVKGYPGIQYPIWMSTLAFPLLTKIVLINCRRFEQLPALGKFPVLEIIHLHGMDGVKNIGSEFYGEKTNATFASLKELSLIDFPNLEFWWSNTGGEEFPSLVKLTINKCPKLMNMPQLSSPRHLELHSCHESILRSAVNITSLSILIISVFSGQLILLDNLLCNNVHLQSLTITSCPNLHCIPPTLGNLVSLKSLTIRWCEELLFLPQELQNLTCLQFLEISECHSLSTLPHTIDGLISLKHLSIENCSNLRWLPSGLQYLSSLQHLTIMYCPGLLSLPTDWHNLSMLRSLSILSCPGLSSLPESIKHVTTLQNLEIHACPGLNVLPEWIGNLSLLRSLGISDCPNLSSLPDGLHCLTNLQCLSIQECPRLEENCKKNMGRDWPKIAHIPHIYIGSPQLVKENIASSSSR